jgi:hypothetical protein
MKPIFFSFRTGLAPAARSAALERIRALPSVEAAGEMFPGAQEGTSAGTMVAAVGDDFAPEEVAATLRQMAEVEEASESAERRLV